MMSTCSRCSKDPIGGSQYCEQHEIEQLRAELQKWKELWWKLRENSGSYWDAYRQGVIDSQTNNVFRLDIYGDQTKATRTKRCE